MSSEIFDTFKDQFSSDVEQLESFINNLSTPEAFPEAVNGLFRIFHNHKAITGYLELDDMNTCVTKVETILNILRKDGHIKDESQIDWLLIVADQMHVWDNELQLGTNLSPSNQSIYTQLKVKETKVSVSTTLASLRLLYIDEDQKSSDMYTPIFNKIFAKTYHILSTKDLKQSVKDYKPDVIMLTEPIIDKNTADIVQSEEKLIPSVGLLASNSKKDLLRLINQGVHYHMVKPLKGNDLKKILHSIVNTHFSKRNILVSNKKIRSFINELDPLNDTMLQIQEICDDPASSIADLIKIIKKDPVTTGMILSATKSPIYALKSINSIDQAVSIFGKMTIKAIALGGLSSRFSPADLSMYGIDELTFTQISQLRMQLMVNWYSQINKALLPVLSVAAFLGNLGQMLMAKELVNLGEEEAFDVMRKSKSILEAEEHYLSASTASITSDMLYFWKMSPTLVDVVSYSDNYEDAVPAIQPLALACQIVFALVPLDKCEIQPISTKVKKLLIAGEFDIRHLALAIKNTIIADS